MNLITLPTLRLIYLFNKSLSASSVQVLCLDVNKINRLLAFTGRDSLVEEIGVNQITQLNMHF